MEDKEFDALSRSLFTRQSRRVVAGLLGGMLALPAVDWAAAGGKKGKKRKKKHHGGKGPKCDQTCGGKCTCKAGSLCDGKTCRPCDVTHDGNNVSSGEKLRQKLAASTGTIRVCPGRYAGYFTHAGGDVLGAGNGTDPATNTILDATGLSVPDGNTRAVLAVASGALSRINNLRVTGSSTQSLHGVYVPAGGTMTLEKGVVTGTRGFGGYGIMVNGTFNALESTISGNGPLSPSVSGGGGIYVDTTSGVYLEKCRVVDNQAYTSHGGGITLFAGNMSIFTTEISGNKALGGAAYRGGGLYSFHGNVSMNSGTRITGNTAGAGGGIYRAVNDDAYPIALDGATVRDNDPDNCVNVTGCTN